MCGVILYTFGMDFVDFLHTFTGQSVHGDLTYHQITSLHTVLTTPLTHTSPQRLTASTTSIWTNYLYQLCLLPQSQAMPC